ncbi:phospholipase D-like domain-containing protein [Leuconostoc mesenteroides]|uniref:helicase-related protein n=1 Tax=Leuconostoc mesenteroides TaxID=1245 RepID=UPI002115C82B|nr:helicase-related protein [Leuconostoc mesenteroides]UUE17209.1 phospholipase D-like domain-containing protein [Leuconostoc mesenteroides]
MDYKDLYYKKVIDNREIDMIEVLQHFLDDEDVRCLNIAVGYFYISGLELIKDSFIRFMNDRNGQFNIIMGNETNSKTSGILSMGADKEVYLENMPKYLDVDTQDVSDKSFLQLVRQWIKEKRIAAKVYVGDANYFHAKSYLFFNRNNATTGHSVVGSSNFSKNGLQGNTELNVYSNDNFFALKEWFDMLWNSDEVKDFSPELLEIVDMHTANDTSVQYYKPTRETYYDFANIFAKPYAELDENTPWIGELYPHQQTGVIDVEDKLNTFGTAILADGVGLGKTRTTAGIIRLAIDKKKNHRSLIIADKKLKVQWSEELAILGVPGEHYDYMSREEFALKKKDELDLIAKEYQLMVIDEAHLGFKNRGTQAYRKIQYVDEKAANLRNPVRGLLLTATPWNNSRKDVLNLGSLFLNIDDIPNDRQYKQYFLYGNTARVINKLVSDDDAFNEFWEDLFLQRTRKTYGGKNVSFAKRNFPIVEIPYEPRKNKLFSDNFDRISELRFPYMDPIKYVVRDRNEIGGDRLKLLLLKRADSSWQAYLNSLNSILDKTNQLLRSLDVVQHSENQLGDFKAFLSRTYKLDEYLENQVGLLTVPGISDDLDEDDIMERFALDSQIKKRRYYDRIMGQIGDIKWNTAKSKVNQMISDANADLAILETLISEIELAYSKRDEKFEKVREVVLKELSEGRKVILVSQFMITAKYYYSKLLDDKALDSSRMGLVTGKSEENRIGDELESKKEILDRFSPKSKKRIDIFGTIEEINLIVGTDTISTGQNLQDAIVIMNLDLPYNPMVLEQRIGRIDRPRPDDKVNNIYIYTFPVYDAIEAELKMTERLGKKMAGVLSDTQFDDIVLPEYVSYLENTKKKKDNAVEKMLDDTLTKTLYQAGSSSEKHSAAYKEANKRMYDMRTEPIHRIENVVYPNISFSSGQDSHSVAVLRFYYKDVNESDIKLENIIVDFSDKENHDITNAEEQLFEEIKNSLYSTENLSIEKSQKLVFESEQTLTDLKKIFVDKYNQAHSIVEDGISSLQDKFSQKAAQNIQESVKNPANREMIMSKVTEAGVKPNMIANLAKNIALVDSESELYEIVKEIAADVGMFWQHFKEYAQLFDVNEIEVSRGASVKKVDNRKANFDKSDFEILLANIVDK